MYVPIDTAGLFVQRNQTCSQNQQNMARPSSYSHILLSEIHNNTCVSLPFFVLVVSATSEGSCLTCQSLHCLQTQRMDVDKGSCQNIDLLRCWLRQHRCVLVTYIYGPVPNYRAPAINITRCSAVSRNTTVNTEIFREGFILAKLRICQVS